MDSTNKIIRLLMDGGVLWCTRTADYEEFNLRPSEVRGRVFAYESRVDFENNMERWKSDGVRDFDAMLGMGVLKLIGVEQIENGDELTINSTAVWFGLARASSMEDDKDVFVL